MNKFSSLLAIKDHEIRWKLRSALSLFKEIFVLAEAVSADEIRQLIKYIPYNVIFLGTELEGGISGLELVKSLHPFPLPIIFVSEKEEQAFQAFELGALDYLLYPFRQERLATTLNRLQKRYPEPGQDRQVIVGLQHEEAEEQPLQLSLSEAEEDTLLNALQNAWSKTRQHSLDIEKLAINQDGRHLLIPYHSIVFVEAFEDYSYVHTASDKFLTSYRLKNLEDRLRKHLFFRIHRKYLVNLDMVTELASLPGGNFMLRTAGKKQIELPISRRRIGELKQLLGL